MDVAGGDIIFLVWTGFFYFFLIFMIEKLNSAGQLTSMFNKEASVEYQEKPYDDGNS